MVRAAVLICVFFYALSASADYRDLLPLLPEIQGYSASPAEGSTLRLPRGSVDTASRRYSSASALLILSIYSGSGVKALEEHGIKAGRITRAAKEGTYTAYYTENGRNKGYIMLTSDGSPLTVVLEYKGISHAQADGAVRSLNPDSFFKKN
ncbi:MAG: hypothetical protein AB7E48_03890 [Deferribacterales bacterium]